MEKSAIITVKSFSDIEPNEAIEVVTPGTFIIHEDGFKAIYEESELSGMDGTTTTLNIKHNSMVLERVGSTSTNMEFNVAHCLQPYCLVKLALMNILF